MELKRALELRTEYAGSAGVIRVDSQDYVCLNEMLAFFPSKRLDDWQRNESTKEFVALIEKTIIPGKSGIIAKRGKGGGTWAHQLIAFELAMWLSPEFKLKVYLEYTKGTQRKENWNIKRIMAANNYKLMCDAIKKDHEEPKPYHFSNEARMINTIAFGIPDFDRGTATEEQLDRISWLESRNGAYMELAMDYQTRKEKLAELYGSNFCGIISPVA